MSWARSALIIWSSECFFCPWTFNEPYELLRFLVPLSLVFGAGAGLMDSRCQVLNFWRALVMREYWIIGCCQLSILPAKVNGSRISLLSHQAALWVFIQTLPVVLPVSMSDFMFLILMNHLKFKGFQMSKWLEGLVVVAPTPSLKSRSVHRSEANIKDWKSFESLEYVWMIW